MWKTSIRRKWLTEISLHKLLNHTLFGRELKIFEPGTRNVHWFCWAQKCFQLVFSVLNHVFLEARIWTKEITQYCRCKNAWYPALIKIWHIRRVFLERKMLNHLSLDRNQLKWHFDLTIIDIHFGINECQINGCAFIFINLLWSFSRVSIWDSQIFISKLNCIFPLNEAQNWSEFQPEQTVFIEER